MLTAALAFLASSGAAAGDATTTLLPPDSHSEESFEVRSSGPSPAKSELSFPTATPFQLPSGHHVWLEGGFLISPFAYSREDLAGRESATMPVGEAGLVTMPPSLRSDRPRALWLLSLVPPFEGETPRAELARSRSIGEVGGGLLMPEGAAVAGIWDVRSRGFVALSKPFQVVARTAVEAPLAEPAAAGSTLVIRLERASPAGTRQEIEASSAALLTLSGELRRADSLLSARDRIYGFWHDLESRPVQLSANTATALLAPIGLDLVPDRIEWVEGTLDPRPTLDVEVALPVPLSEQENLLEVRALPGAEILAQAQLPPGTWSHRFSGLAPGLVRVDLRTVSGTFTEEVELQVAGSAFVRLEPEVIVVSGTVFLGDEPQPSKLLFMTVDQETTEVLTDAEGVYQIAGLAALRYVAVEPQGVEMATWSDFFVPAVTESTELDIHVPDVRFRVFVFDVESDAPVAGARVSFRNSFAAEGLEKSIAQVAETDDEGVARLPPLRPGSVELQASAPGYFAMQEPVRRQVDEDDRDFEIGLQPAGSRVAVHLTLPGGAPARGAELMLVDSLATARSILADTADAEGVVRLSREAHGHVLVRHPEAAFLIREWRPSEDLGEVRWALPAAFPMPLSLAIKDRQGEAARRAWITLWVGGIRLSGLSLAWLTDSRPYADNNGLWSGSHLPAAPLAVFACAASHRNQAEAGAYDALTLEISPPWPPLLEVTTVAP